jgi:hypothetical protein
MATIYRAHIRKVGHREYRCAPRGTGLVYEVTRTTLTDGRPGDLFDVARVEADGTRTMLAGPYVYADPPRSLEACECIIYGDLVERGHA